MSNLKQKRFVDTDYFHEQLDSTTVEVEGSHISATETKIGYTTDIEILGNTIQDASNLADIRSVGDKVEGQELYEIPVLSRGKNLFDGVIIDKALDADTGNLFDSADWFTTNYIMVNSDKITFSTNTSASEINNLNFTIVMYDTNYKFIGNVGFYNNNSGTWTLIPNTKYIRVRLPRANYSNIQIEEGTVATPYEPYQEDKLTILSPVQLEKVGDVADRIVCKDGVWGVEKLYQHNWDNISFTVAINQFDEDDLTGKYNVFRLMKSQYSLIERGIYPFFRLYGSFAENFKPYDGECVWGNDAYLYFKILKGKTTLDEFKAGKSFDFIVLSDNSTFIPLPHDQQIKLRTFANKTNISFLTEIEGYIKCKVPKSVGGTLESLVEKAKITDDRIEMLETVSEGNNMKYSTDKGVIHCKDTRKGRVNDLTIEGNTMVNYCRDGSKTLTLNGDINEVGTHITTTNAVNNGKVDVMCEGNTLVNLVRNASNVTVKYNSNGQISLGLSRIKTNQLYTVVIRIKNNTLDKPIRFSGWSLYNGYSTDNGSCYYHEPMNSVNRNDRQCFSPKQVGEYKTLIGMSNITIGKSSHITLFVEGEATGSATFECLVLEGDWTDKEIPSYFEGLSSVGQDDENGHNIEILSSKGKPNLIRNSGFLNDTVGYSFHNGSRGEVIDDVSSQSGKILKITTGSYGDLSGPFQPNIVSHIENKTYTLSGWCKGEPGTSIGIFIERHKSKTITFTNDDWVRFVVTSDQNPTNWNRTITFYSTNLNKVFYLKDIKMEESENDTPYVPHIEERNYATFKGINKKSITLNEPLRSLPNGVKDRFVKMNNKWYIERNCREADGSELIFNRVHQPTYADRFAIQCRLDDCVKDHMVDNNLICNNLPCVLQGYDKDYDNISSHKSNDGIYINLSKSKYNYNGTNGESILNNYISNNNLKLVCQRTTPVYEELTVDPTLTTYVDCTHISTNSVIPCNMKVKNSGYSTIIKPSTLYTVALDTNKSGEVKVNLGGAEKTTTNNILTITTPSTLVDDSLRISGKGLTSTNVRLLEGDKTNFIPSYFEGLKSSFEEKQGDNHIVEVISNNRNLVDYENTSFDKIIIKENGKFVIPQNSNVTWMTSSFIKVRPNTTYTLKISGLESGVRWSVARSKKVSYDSHEPHVVKYCHNTEETQFTTGATDHEICIGLCNDSGYTNQKPRLEFTIHVECINKSPISYTPHKSNKIQFTTLAPLRSVGDISDKLVYKDNKWMIERNCGEIQVSKEDNWREVTGTDNLKRFTVQLTDKIFTTNGNHFEIVSDKFITSEATQSNYGYICSYANYDSLFIYSKHNLEDFDKDIKIVYQLDKPYYEEIGEYRNLDSYDEGTTIYANTLIAPKNLSFNLATHMSNIVKDVQDDVSDLKTWRSEVFDSLTHKKTFDSGFTTVEDTKEGVIDEVKLEGKTLVNLAKTFRDSAVSGWLQVVDLIYDVTDKTITVCNLSDKNIKFQTSKLDNSYNNQIIIKPFSSVVVVFNNVKFRMIQGAYSDGWTSSDLDIFKKSIVVLEGDHTQNPPSYFKGLKSVGEDVEEISVESVNGNLFDATLDTQTKNGVTFSYDGATGEIVLNGTCTENNTCVYFKHPTKFMEGNRYYLRIFGTTINSPLAYIRVYDDKYVGNNLATTSREISIHKSSSTRKMVNTSIRVDSGITFNNFRFKVQLIVNEDRAEYIPHQSDKKRLLYYNPETQAWEKPILCEWDSIEKHADGKYYYHQRSGEVVLNGSESWGLINTGVNTTLFLCISNILAPTGDTTVRTISDRIPGNSFANRNTDIEMIYTHNNEFAIRILNTKLSSQDVQGFKQWLQDNNVTVVYQLAQEKVYEVFNIELNSYDGETNVIVNSGAISPITTVSLTSNLPQVAENLKNRVRQLEAQIYNYKVTQNLRQLRTFYKSDYANFGVATVGNTFVAPTSLEITPYGYDLFELFKEIISEGKDCYDRIELEEYIDFYVMTFIFDFEMAFELFDMIDSQHLDTEIEDEPIEDEENSEIIEDEPIDPDFSVDYEEPTIEEDIDVEMGVIPEDELIDVEMGVIPNDDLIDIEMGVIPNEDIDVEFSVDVEEEDQTKDEDLEV